MKPERNYTISKNKRRVSIPDALDALSKIREGIPSDFCFEHGTLLVKMYHPSGQDPQKPHTRDEIYVIARGSGWFVNGSDRLPFQTGDVLFVPAGVVHRFVEFTEDFCTWVMFYGPEGGERVEARGSRKNEESRW